MKIVLFTNRLITGGYMLIETTINVNIDIKIRLAVASEACGISISNLIVKLMKRAMKKPEVMVRCFTRIQYQQRAPKNLWRRLHVTLFSRDYEYFLDMRKLSKRSVSLLVAISTENLLDALLVEVMNENYDEEADNYPFDNYIIQHNKFGVVSCWKIYWGIPENPETVLLI
jgi:hypothetical protein